jgi:ankyrin repeat protein
VWAARFGQPAVIQLLIKNGADPNARSGVNGWPVLMHAIHKDQPQAVKALLSNGASPNTRGDSDETALMMAAGYGYSDIVRILLDHGADARATRSNGENALDFALSGMTDIDRFTFGHCQTEVVRVLRDKVPDLTAKNGAKLKRCS